MRVRRRGDGLEPHLAEFALLDFARCGLDRAAYPDGERDPGVVDLDGPALARKTGRRSMDVTDRESGDQPDVRLTASQLHHRRCHLAAFPLRHQGLHPCSRSTPIPRPRSATSDPTLIGVAAGGIARNARIGDALYLSVGPQRRPPSDWFRLPARHGTSMLF